ncbi:hypothetical protein CK203_048273 [Vitis vinifera]|uniref:Reverse transcriptase RNase H-like domain-containing protein n=1 Tax=Vitis vinifera TaxID=29760 RepID=A0A438H051_VITVI|nr:hypothetical protein CK203_048273 [Vitis vinifera]
MRISCMLAQLDDSGKDRAIYYLSKRMLDYETRYVMIERYCLALVWATRLLRHYMTEYSVHLISRLDPLRYLFDRPALSIRGSIVADHLASLPVSDARAIDDDFLDEDVAAATSLSGWRISVRLAFSDRHPTTNNIVEYEACILGLKTALELGIRQMEVFGDSNPAATTKDRRALRQLAARFVICGETLYRRSADGMAIIVLGPCLRRSSDERDVRVSDTWGPHSRATFRVARTDFTLAVSVWGIDIIRKISPKSFSGHKFILVAIDYFTKWVEAASYARLTSSGVARQRLTPWYSNIASDIIGRLRTGRRRKRGSATPYSLVYGMEAVLPVEIEMGFVEGSTRAADSRGRLGSGSI